MTNSYTGKDICYWEIATRIHCDPQWSTNGYLVGSGDSSYSVVNEELKCDIFWWMLFWIVYAKKYHVIYESVDSNWTDLSFVLNPLLASCGTLNKVTQLTAHVSSFVNSEIVVRIQRLYIKYMKRLNNINC